MDSLYKFLFAENTQGGIWAGNKGKIMIYDRNKHIKCKILVFRRVSTELFRPLGYYVA
jgi:hypothetical protein